MPHVEDLLRHCIETIVYRLEKAIRNAPPEYPTLRIGNGGRTPVEILSHISFELTCAHSVFRHYERFEEPEAGSWKEEIERFYQIVGKLDRSIAKGLPDREPHRGEAAARPPVGRHDACRPACDVQKNGERSDSGRKLL